LYRWQLSSIMIPNISSSYGNFIFRFWNNTYQQLIFFLLASTFTNLIFIFNNTCHFISISKSTLANLITLFTIYLWYRILLGTLANLVSIFTLYLLWWVLEGTLANLISFVTLYLLWCLLESTFADLIYIFSIKSQPLCICYLFTTVVWKCYLRIRFFVWISMITHHCSWVTYFFWTF